MRRITLEKSTRTFERVEEGGRSLARTGKAEPAGASLVVSEPLTMVYDHREQMAVYFRKGEKELFLLVDELGREGFVQ